MLFLTIYTWEPEKRDVITKRRAEKGNMVPKGVKIIGEWTDLGGGRGFMLFETAEPKIEWTLAWSDLMKMDVIPVVDTEKDVMSLLS